MTEPQNIQKEKRTMHIDTRLTQNEYETIQNKSKQTGLSASEYIRRVCMNYPLKSVVDQAAVKDMLNIRADMNRMGGLYKKFLVEHKDIMPNLGKRSYLEISRIVDRIETRQEEILQIAQRIIKEKKRI